MDGILSLRNFNLEFFTSILLYFIKILQKFQQEDFHGIPRCSMYKVPNFIVLGSEEMEIEAKVISSIYYSSSIFLLSNIPP